MIYPLLYYGWILEAEVAAVDLIVWYSEVYGLPSHEEGVVETKAVTHCRFSALLLLLVLLSLCLLEEDTWRRFILK